MTRQRTLFTFCILWLLTTAYIALFPTRHFTPDAVNNLVFLEGRNVFELWHSQHLLAQWPGYWTYQLLYTLTNGTIRAWQAMQIAHAMLAGLTVALVYLCALELTRSQRIAIASGVILWFGYGFWHFQSDPDIYSMGYVGAALLMLAFIRYVLSPGSRRMVVLAVAAAFAALTHQLNIELVGLIGLTLIFLAVRTRVRWRDVAIYAGLSAAIVIAVYFVGWLSVNAYLVKTGIAQLSFSEWALRYFVIAQSGKATWGNSSHLSTLPTAGYTFLLSWILPPLFENIPIWQAALLGLLLIGAVVLFLHTVFVMRHFPMPQRLVAVVCGLTLIAEGISGWWWQTGNVKFYLLMQVNLIVLAALYAQYIMCAAGWNRRIGRAVLGLVALSLVLFQVGITLPYETKGGVFTVSELAVNAPSPLTIYFEDTANRDAFQYVTSGVISLALSPGFCTTPPLASALVWWVVTERTASQCPAVEKMMPIGRYQASRSREVWVVFKTQS